MENSTWKQGVPGCSRRDMLPDDVAFPAACADCATCLAFQNHLSICCHPLIRLPSSGVTFSSDLHQLQSFTPAANDLLELELGWLFALVTDGGGDAGQKKSKHEDGKTMGSND
eukprot:scaffold50669_cov26-Tisochrysis_lutea.AAC.5